VEYDDVISMTLKVAIIIIVVVIIIVID